jgi:hypothetical protein
MSRTTPTGGSEASEFVSRAAAFERTLVRTPTWTLGTETPPCPALAIRGCTNMCAGIGTAKARQCPSSLPPLTKYDARGA